MSIFFRILSMAYIAGIFLFADSPMVSEAAPFNPYSLLHIPLYGILTFLLIFSNFASPFKFINKRNQMNSKDSIDPKNSKNPTNSINLLIPGSIALVVAIADEIHQAYIPSRDASIIDVFLDIVGISLCLLLIKRIGQISGFSKIPKFLRRIP